MLKFNTYKDLNKFLNNFNLNDYQEDDFEVIKKEDFLENLKKWSEYPSLKDLSYEEQMCKFEEGVNRLIVYVSRTNEYIDTPIYINEYIEYTFDKDFIDDEKVIF